MILYLKYNITLYELGKIKNIQIMLYMLFKRNSHEFLENKKNFKSNFWFCIGLSEGSPIHSKKRPNPDELSILVWILDKLIICKLLIAANDLKQVDEPIRYFRPLSERNTPIYKHLIQLPLTGLQSFTNIILTPQSFESQRFHTLHLYSPRHSALKCSIHLLYIFNPIPGDPLLSVLP